MVAAIRTDQDTANMVPRGILMGIADANSVSAVQNLSLIHI